GKRNRNPVILQLCFDFVSRFGAKVLLRRASLETFDRWSCRLWRACCLRAVWHQGGRLAVRRSGPNRGSGRLFFALAGSTSFPLEFCRPPRVLACCVPPA